MATDSDIMFTTDDVGKNLYRKKTYYTLVIEQDVLANSKDEADEKFGDCGIDHSAITSSITEQKNGVETYYTDADYLESEETQFLGKVKYDTDTYNQTLEEAMDNGDVHIDTDADENEPHQLTKIKLVVNE